MVSGDLKVLDQSYRRGNLCIGSVVLCPSAVVVMVTAMQVGVVLAVVRGLMVESVVESVEVGCLVD